MTLELLGSPITEKLRKNNALVPGTWFIDDVDQIFVVVRDDRTGESRIVCTGHFFTPYIVNAPCKSWRTSRLLKGETKLKITKALTGGLV